MAIITPPTIDPVPTPVPHRGDPSNFSAAMDANVDWQAAAPPQFDAVAQNVVHNATEAMNSATAAAGSVTAATAQVALATAQTAAATTQANIATTQAGTATTQAGIATTKAAEAAASAVTAASNAAAFTATSTTSLAVGAGSKVFTIQASKQLPNGTPVSAVSVGASANKMFGTVASYSGTTLTVTMTDYEGSGTYADWAISPSGARGPTGGVTGGNLTGSLNELKGADVASATTPDIWASGGNYEIITGTASITGFAAAPQAGARRRILAGAAFSIVAGANMIIKGVVSGQTYIATAGDEIDVVAETTTKFRITVTKGDGSAMAAMFGAFQCCVTSESSGVFTARRTGWHRITTIGSPGRPGAVNAANTTARATGAGAGGFCSDARFLIAGVTYPYTVGAGTASVTVNPGAAVNGVDGSASSFALAGSATITANGGGAGAAQLAATAMTGGLGGTASGGAINVTGGAGGDVLGTSAGRAASGGGAVGVQGLIAKGGNATPSASSDLCAAGGAGTGGNGGSAAGNTTGGGGGAGGAASGNTGGLDYAGKASTAVATVGPATSSLENATAGGPNGGGSAAQNGAGAAGQNTSAGFGNSSPTPLAGGGAIVYVADSAMSGSALRPAAAGGPGGIVANNTATFITVPAGPNGKMYFEF